jgi:type IV fimbrial biogenesis protein FimT
VLRRDSYSLYLARTQGFSLVELVVVIAIIGIVMGVALPMYQTWIRNTQIRTAADSIQNGLQLARTTAVQRNAQTEFVFTAADPISANGSAGASVAGQNWMVRFSDISLPAASRFVQGRAIVEGSRNVQITKPQATFAFSSLGRLVSPPAAGQLTIQVTDPNLSAGDVRSLNIVIEIGGGIRMCDPKLTLTKPNDPQAC